jgi:hypothetical protein
MLVLDAVRRRKGQPDLNQGSGILPGAPLVLSHTYLILLVLLFPGLKIIYPVVLKLWKLTVVNLMLVNSTFL